MENALALPILMLGLSTHAAPTATDAQNPANPQYHLVAEIPIRGSGGWDALTVDADAHRLFVSHQDRVVVIDTIKNAVETEILGTPGVHDIAIAPDLKKAYVTNGTDASVSVVDLAILKVKTKVKVGEKPDIDLYEPDQHEVYIFNGKSDSLSIIDPKTDTVVHTLALAGKPEFAVADPEAHRVYVNIEDKNTVAVLDTKTHKILESWKLEGCESPSGMAIDIKTHRLFSACENQKMIVLNTKSGKIISLVPTGEGTDGAEFDSELHLIFSPNGKTATTTIIHEEGPEKFSVTQTLPTHVGARTMALDPKTHRIYLPTADYQPAEKGNRPQLISGTQRVLVFGF